MFSILRTLGVTCGQAVGSGGEAGAAAAADDGEAWSCGDAGSPRPPGRARHGRRRRQPRGGELLPAEVELPHGGRGRAPPMAAPRSSSSRPPPPSSPWPSSPLTARLLPAGIELPHGGRGRAPPWPGRAPPWRRGFCVRCWRCRDFGAQPIYCA